MTSQKSLFPLRSILNKDPLKKYEMFFQNLDTSPLEKSLYTQGGRPSVSKPALLKALIFKNVKTIPTLSDLSTLLSESVDLSEIMELKSYLNPLALVERLSSFLKLTPNQTLQEIKNSLLLKLIKAKVINGKMLSFDSCPIKMPLKENNLKTSTSNRFDKTLIPKRDSDCRLGVIIHYSKPFQKETTYFWGYRNHALTDAKAELPIAEFTKPANASDSKQAIPLLELARTFPLSIKKILGDSAYDAEYILNYIVNELKAEPYIAKNPRWSAKSNVKPSSTGGLICIAGFEMIYWGKFKDRGKIRKKFVCPITHSKKFAARIPACPWNHPKFLKGSGCIAYLRGDLDIRTTIDYGSKNFKKNYNFRTSSERLFSRLLSISMQSPTVFGLNAVSNLCTVAHITVLLLALTAYSTGFPDKTRFIKKFLPSL